MSEYGKIVNRAINAIPLYYQNMKIDEYVIMHDHVHLILIISNNENKMRMMSERVDNICPYNDNHRDTKSIATVIGQMKRRVSKDIGFPIWQKSYYEHIIRNEEDYISKAEYIRNNTQKWELERD